MCRARSETVILPRSACTPNFCQSGELDSRSWSRRNPANSRRLGTREAGLGELAAKVVVPDELFRFEALDADLSFEVGARLPDPDNFVFCAPSVPCDPKNVSLADAFNLHQLGAARRDFAGARRTNFGGFAV